MNLLRCFTGIEVARVGDSPAAFLEFEKGVGALTERIVNYINPAMELINDVTFLLRTEIKNEAVSQLKAAVAILRKAAAEGEDIAAKGMAAAHTLSHGTLARISREAKERAANTLQAAAAALAELTAEIEKKDAGSVYTFFKAPIDALIKSNEESAFCMNINAFNAAIEAARSGGDEDFIKFAGRIRNYAWQIHQANKTCADYFSESAKLIELAFDSAPCPLEEENEKSLSDIIFQGSLLAAQFGLEAERACKVYDGFVPLAKKAEELVNDLMAKKISVSVYAGEMTGFTEKLNAEVKKSGVYAPPFAYIAKEYGYYAQRARAII
jgi:hypothetical protein